MVSDTMTHERRTLLKYIGATSAAGILAGCGGDGGNGGEDDDDGGNDGPVQTADTVTTLLDQAETDAASDDGTGTQTESEPDCVYETVEPQKESGSAELWLGRTTGAMNLLEDTIQIYQADYGVTIDTSNFQTNFQAKLQTEIPAGNGPHAFQWAHDLAGSWDEAGYLSDQKEGLRVDPCQYTETAWNASQYDGQVIGLPLAAETVTLLYNKDMVDEPPETLSEMQSIMEEHHDPGNGQYGLGYQINPYFVSAFAQAYGADIYNGEEDELGVDSDELAKGLRIVFEELKPYMPSDPGRGTQTTAFRDGNAAFSINGPWELPNLNDAGVDYGLTTLPELPDGGTPRPYMGVQLLYFAAKASEKPESGTVVREFAEWYTTNETRILNLANNAGYVPVHSALADHPQLPESVKAYAEQVQTGYPMPASPKMNQVWGPFGDAVQNAYNNPDQLEESLDVAANEIREQWASN